MMITTEGIIIRISCAGISILGRITSGVKLINLDTGVTVASLAKVREKVDENVQTETDSSEAEEDLESMEDETEYTQDETDSQENDDSEE